jgi:hypothetical protein
MGTVGSGGYSGDGGEGMEQERAGLTGAREVKWFVGRGLWDEEPFAVYRAEFEGQLLLAEQVWRLSDTHAGKWEKSDQVGKWFFVGEDTVWPSSEEIATSLLPTSAMETINEVTERPSRNAFLAISIEGNPYDDSPFPQYMSRLVRIVTAYISKKVSPWVLEAVGNQSRSPYIQARFTSDGRLMCEITGNSFLENKLDGSSLEKLSEYGWQVGDGKAFPNNWFSADLNAVSPEYVAEKMVRALVEIYKVNFTYSFHMTPHPLNAGFTIEVD